MSQPRIHRNKMYTHVHVRALKRTVGCAWKVQGWLAGTPWLSDLRSVLFTSFPSSTSSQPLLVARPSSALSGEASSLSTAPPLRLQGAPQMWCWTFLSIWFLLRRKKICSTRTRGLCLPLFCAFPLTGVAVVIKEVSDCTDNSRRVYFFLIEFENVMEGRHGWCYDKYGYENPQRGHCVPSKSEQTLRRNWKNLQHVPHSKSQEESGIWKVTIQLVSIMFQAVTLQASVFRVQMSLSHVSRLTGGFISGFRVNSYPPLS